MDPNANLEELRELIKELTHQIEHEDNVSLGSTMRALELMDALDEWLSKGGFLPKAWERGTNEPLAPELQDLCERMSYGARKGYASISGDDCAIVEGLIKDLEKGRTP